jgi:CRISPR type IV-associated DEAD/DEAH-box helicase Csf4
VAGSRGTRRNDPVGTIIGRLVETAFYSLREQVHETTSSDQHRADTGTDGLPRPPTGRRYRPEQLQISKIVAEAFRQHSVVLIESATGSGKGLVIAANAYAVAQAGGRVVIASPTHAVGSQTLRELSALKATNGFDPLVSIVRGRSEYVSELELVRFLDDSDAQSALEPDAVAAALTWHAKAAHSNDPASSWRCDALASACPSIPVRLLSVRPDHDPSRDGGAAAYELQFQSIQESRIVMATHAMLTVDTLQRLSRHRADFLTRDQDEPLMEYWKRDHEAKIERDSEHAGRLGAYTHLFIDEAHELEANVTRTASSAV